MGKYIFFVLFLFTLSFLGCSNVTESLNIEDSGDIFLKTYEQIHLSAKDKVPIAVEIERQFRNAVLTHMITGYGQGKTRWQTVVFFGERYRLTMGVDVVVDYTRKSIVQVGDCSFLLNEVAFVTDPQGRIGARFGKQWMFSERDWKTLVQNRFDFEKIDIILNEQPVPDFDKFAKAATKACFPIRLLEGED